MEALAAAPMVMSSPTASPLSSPQRHAPHFRALNVPAMDNMDECGSGCVTPKSLFRDEEPASPLIATTRRNSDEPMTPVSVGSSAGLGRSAIMSPFGAAGEGGEPIEWDEGFLTPPRSTAASADASMMSTSSSVGRSDPGSPQRGTGDGASPVAANVLCSTPPRLVIAEASPEQPDLPDMMRRGSIVLKKGVPTTPRTLYTVSRRAMHMSRLNAAGAGAGAGIGITVSSRGDTQGGQQQQQQQQQQRQQQLNMQRGRMMGRPGPLAALRANEGVGGVTRPTSAPADAARPLHQNPFTPGGGGTGSKRAGGMAHGTSASELGGGTGIVNKRRRAFDGASNISRYANEYVELERVGSGNFGTVYKVQHRLDGITYAIKRSNKAIATFADEQRLLREVYAHAVIQVQPHIVRYYSAWEEDNRMLIQSEFCDGGSLEGVIDDYQRKGRSIGENELCTIMRHAALGLKCLHKQGLAHLDVKPGNIFIKTEVPMESVSDGGTSTPAVSPAPGADDVFFFAGEAGISGSSGTASSSSTGARRCRVYKLGDLGMVTRIDDPEVEEGDCRYLCREIMNENYSQLIKADIFSLGCSVYEAACGHDLPKNGTAWHELRDGEPRTLERYSENMNKLLRSMLHPDPTQRPTTDEVLGHAWLQRSSAPYAAKSKSQLHRELEAERIKTKQLEKMLEARQCDSSTETSGGGARAVKVGEPGYESGLDEVVQPPPMVRAGARAAAFFGRKSGRAQGRLARSSSVNW